MSGTGYDPSRGLPGPPGPAGSFTAVESTADLRGLADTADPDAVFVLNEGGIAGLFVKDELPGIDNGGTRFNTGGLGSNEPGLRRVDPSPLNVRWFNAKGDGVTDDTAAILRALNTLKAMGGGELFFPEGVYLTDPINIQGPGGGNWANIRLTGTTKRSATSGGSIIRARGVQEYVLRAAGQNVTAENLTFDGNFLTTNAVVFFDYQSFGSGLDNCFITRTFEPEKIPVTPNSDTDTFDAVGHALVDGDTVIFQTTATLPTELFQPAEYVNNLPEALGAYNWVWHVINASPTGFQVEPVPGYGAWSFSTNGSGVITVQKVGGSLVRIGGPSGLQADTGYIHNTIFIQDITNFNRLAGRSLFISDANAVLWDIQKCHFQGFIDGIYVRGGGCSIRECTIFGMVSVSRSHLVKDGQTSLVHVSDETYTEVDAVTWLVVIGTQAADYNQPWVFDFPFLNVGRGNINWDCRQPLQLRGGLGGDVHVTPEGNQYVTGFGVNFPLVGDTTPTFKGDLRKVIRIGQTDRTLRVVTEAQRIAGASPDPLENALAGHGLFLSGGESADITVKKAGPVVTDLGEARVVYGNQSASKSFARREQTALTIVGIVGNVLESSVAHGLTLYDSVRFSTTGAMPGNLSAAVDYWAIPVDATHFSVSVSQGDTVAAITSAGSGVLTAKVLKNFLTVTFDLSNLPGLANATRLDSVGPMYIAAPGSNIKLTPTGVAVSALIGANTLSVGTSVVPANQGEAFFDYDGTPADGAAIYEHSDANAYGFLFNVDKTAAKYLRSKGGGYAQFDATTGDFVWKTAPVGVAGNAIALTERMRLKQAGTLNVAGLGAGIVHAAAGGDLSSSTIVNADVNAAAAIAGSKVAPDFGAQEIKTTGRLTTGTQAGFTGGGVVGLTAPTGGALSTAAGQACVYNDSGICSVQGNSGVYLYHGTTLAALALSTQFVVQSAVCSGKATSNMSYRGSNNGNPGDLLNIQAYKGSWATVIQTAHTAGPEPALWLAANGGALRFFNDSTGAAGATKQTVIGSRGGNAALASLLTALAAYGLIVDSSTA